MRITAKKHWFSYISYIILLFLFVLPSIIFFIKTEDSQQINMYLRYGVLFFGIWIFYKALRNIILTSRVQWVFEDGALTIKSGFLWWKRTAFTMWSSQIYEAYYTKSFMGTILGFGGVHIRRTDGLTTEFSQLTMTNHKKIIAHINTAIIDVKNNSIAKEQKTEHQISVTDELKKLADLKEDGTISEAEFEKLKKKLIKV